MLIYWLWALNIFICFVGTLNIFFFLLHWSLSISQAWKFFPQGNFISLSNMISSLEVIFTDIVSHCSRLSCSRIWQLSGRVIREMLDKWKWLYVPAAQMLMPFSADTNGELNTPFWDTSWVKCDEFNEVERHYEIIWSLRGEKYHSCKKRQEN